MTDKPIKIIFHAMELTNGDAESSLLTISVDDSMMDRLNRLSRLAFMESATVSIPVEIEGEDGLSDGSIVIEPTGHIHVELWREVRHAAPIKMISTGEVLTSTMQLAFSQAQNLDETALVMIQQQSRCPVLISEERFFSDFDYMHEVVNLMSEWPDTGDTGLKDLAITDIQPLPVSESLQPAPRNGLKEIFLVSGRVPFDDDDTVHLVEAGDLGSAVDIFTRALNEEDDPEREVYINVEMNLYDALTHRLRE